MFDIFVVNPLTNFVLGFYFLFGNSLGLAIIFFTIFLRIILLPLTIKQIQLQKKMAELQPKIQELQVRKKDPSQMTPEEMALMKQAASNLLGGCLPILIQIPILIGLNMVIANIASVNADPSKGGDFFNNILYFEFLKHSNDYLFNTSFFGLDLAEVPARIGLQWDLIPYALLIIFLVLTQFIHSKIMNIAQQKRVESYKKNRANKKKLTKEEKEKEEMQEAMNKLTQFQLTYFLPLMVGVGAYSFSAALGLYWLVQNIFAILQTMVQYGYLDGKMNLALIKKNFADYRNKILAKRKKC